jgi:hypothetical protein
VQEAALAAELATKSDLESPRAELNADIAELRADMR